MGTNHLEVAHPDLHPLHAVTWKTGEDLRKARAALRSGRGRTTQPAVAENRITTRGAWRFDLAIGARQGSRRREDDARDAECDQRQPRSVRGDLETQELDRPAGPIGV